MWVRSQDKSTLARSSNFWIMDYASNVEIVGSLDVSGNRTLGCYKSKERAIEVLDDIQNHLYWVNGFGIANKNYKVYEMPEV